MIRPCLRWIFAAALPLTAAVSCASNGSTRMNHSVQWFEAFTLGQALAEPVETTSVEDVRRAISAHWWGPIEVTSRGGNTMSLSTCEDYLTVRRDRVRPDDPTYWKPFMGRAMMCQAAWLIVSAQAPDRSFVRTLKFDQTLPDLLPPELAFTISSSSVERVQQAAPGETWRDMFGIKRHESCDKRDGEHCGIYYDSTGGRQRVQLVARGDFNADGIEDVLISSHNSVEGGTYAATQMYVLTRRTADGEIEVLRELEY